MPTYRLSPTAASVAAAAACLQLLATLPAAAQTADRTSPACAAAMQSYNNMRTRTTMDEAQYAATPEGGAVRAACGGAALANIDNSALNPVRPVTPAPAPFVPPSAASAPAPAPSVPAFRPPAPAPAVPLAAPPARIISPTPVLPSVRAVPAAPTASR